MERIKQILEDYHVASGQKVNLSKSSITFGKKVDQDQRDLIRVVTGINNTGGEGIYLGLPETFVGSKVSTLSFLEERVSKKINSWSTKFLSQGGKEVMIKAVSMALPTYTMSCFLLSKTLYVRR